MLASPLARLFNGRQALGSPAGNTAVTSASPERQAGTGRHQHARKQAGWGSDLATGLIRHAYRSKLQLQLSTILLTGSVCCTEVLRSEATLLRRAALAALAAGTAPCTALSLQLRKAPCYAHAHSLPVAHAMSKPACYVRACMTAHSYRARLRGHAPAQLAAFTKTRVRTSWGSA